MRGTIANLHAMNPEQKKKALAQEYGEAPQGLEAAKVTENKKEKKK